MSSLSEEFLRSMAQRIEAHMNRKRYDSLTEEILNSLPDDKLEQAIVDCAFAQRGPSTQLGDRWSSLPDPQVAVVATRIAEGDISNGGFDQFFGNFSLGDVRDVIWGYRALEMWEIADLVIEAVIWYAANQPGWEAAIKELERRYYAEATPERTSAVRVQFVRRNLQQFVMPPRADQAHRSNT